MQHDFILFNFLKLTKTTYIITLKVKGGYIMKKLLVVIAAIVVIGVAAISTSTTEQAYDTWQPEPMLTSIPGNDI